MTAQGFGDALMIIGLLHIFVVGPLFLSAMAAIGSAWEGRFMGALAAMIASGFAHVLFGLAVIVGGRLS